MIHRLLRPSGVELLARIVGLLLSAIAVQLTVGAIRADLADKQGPLYLADKQKGLSMKARVQRIETGNADRNAWVIGDDEEVIVVDPGEDTDRCSRRSATGRSSR